ncbi:MAG: DUF4114 domain-containing protein [Cyclobacteriaceae bacterium]
MKARISCIVLLLMSFACNDDEKFQPVDPVPPEIFHVDLCPALEGNATALFPESRNNQEIYNDLFSSGTQQRIVLAKDADVYVSFVSEAANIGNVLGYYIYKSSSVPGSPEDIEKQLIFPNVDNAYLTAGDTRKLGTAQFKAGTVIGFFLIVGGYRDGGVYFKRPTFYTDQNWNAGKVKQHVLYRESECAAIVMGFEDKDSATADKDFNDIIFTVSDNISNQGSTSFDVQNVVTLSK